MTVDEINKKRIKDMPKALKNLTTSTKQEPITLLQQILIKYPDTKYSTWQSDLYIKHSKEVMNYIKSIHSSLSNIKTFIDNIDNELYIDIPFGYFAEFLKEKD